jgi:transcriptional regulator with XRE-family HTH domain
VEEFLIEVKMMNDDIGMKKAPSPVDRYVGSRVRMRRITVGMSQEKLGEALGVTFQQVQKYEKGANRISASRMQNISQVLGVSVAFFFEGAPRDENIGMALGFAEPAQSEYRIDILSTPEGVALAKAFTSIDDPKVRRRVVDLVATLVEGQRKP